MALNANVHVSILPNKMGWLSVNTVISSQLHLPAWHKDYLPPPHANQSTPSQGSLLGTRYTQSPFISYSNLSFAHCTFLANISTHREPSSHDQVILSPHWKEAMEAELSALTKHNA